MRRKRIVVLLSIIVIGFTCYSAALCAGLAMWAAGPDTCSPQTPKNTEELGQFKFPPSTNKLTSSCFGLQGWGGNAQFEMLPTDLAFLVEHSQMKAPLVKTGIPVDILHATQISTLTSYLHGSYHTVYPSGKTFWQDILIDTTNPTLYVVYINFSGG